MHCGPPDGLKKWLKHFPGSLDEMIGPSNYENPISENFTTNIIDLDTQTCGFIDFTGKYYQ